MSAFMVDKEHIDVLVSLALRGPSGVTVSPGNAWYELRWVAEGDLRYLNAGTADEVGQMLIGTNLDSIHARYPDTVTDPHNIPGPLFTYWEVPYGFEDPGVRLGVLDGLAAISCYEYQSCEHDGWWSSEAHSFCEALRASLIRRLEGYGETVGHWTAERVAERRGARR